MAWQVFTFWLQTHLCVLPDTPSNHSYGFMKFLLHFMEYPFQDPKVKKFNLFLTSQSSQLSGGEMHHFQMAQGRCSR